MELDCNKENYSYADRGDKRIVEYDSGGLSLRDIYCSICLEVVTYHGDRSFAKLGCGHEFHLDCIGSAFNVKGVMECPNCRQLEDGRWLYANGRSLYDINLEDLSQEEDLYETRSHAEMSGGGRWCPYRNLTRLHHPYEERNFPSNAFPEFASSTSQPSPYVTYLGTVHHHSSSPSSSSLYSRWNAPHFSSQNPNSHRSNAMDLRYQNWELTSRRHVSSPPDVAPSVYFPFATPSWYDRSASGNMVSSISPEYQESDARTRSRVEALQAYYQQQPGSRRGDGYRAYPRPDDSSPEPNGLLYVQRPSFPESEQVLRLREGENICTAEREITQSLTIRSESGIVRSSVRMRQGTERVFWS